ncbi:MAG: sigma-70 family RNA polymerase sigma factor [Chloracidobacterium sp.]|nr:sigma-70 family RNA polymerase sigma factor [Chloracidobacterium sp.]MDW8216825.1 sigma-70 family RNA polymerase sigma factor [Acidobacteriota bacterium]
MSGTQPSFPNVNRDALIEQHLHYVRTIAYDIVRKLPPSVELDELIAYGNLGLVRAAEKYNPARGVSFITFAHYYIKGAIWDEVRKMANFARIDGGRARAEANATDFLHALAEEDTGTPTPGATLDDDIAEARAQLESLIPIYLLSLDHEALAIADDNSLDFARALERDDLIGRMMRLVAQLPDEDRATIEALYFKGQSAADYAAELGLSRSWGSRLHARAIKRLREAMKREGLLNTEEVN